MIKITYRPVEALTADPRNRRSHREVQIEQIARSIQEFGFTNPVLIDEQGQIIAGHGRLTAAIRLGFTEVPCIEISHMTSSQKRAYVVADNKLALNAGWDEDLLKLELGELAEEGIAIALTGFSDDELDKLYGRNPLDDEWNSDLSRVDSIEPKNTSAKGKFVVTFNEWDREELREAITNMIDQLGLDGVSVQ